MILWILIGLIAGLAIGAIMATMFFILILRGVTGEKNEALNHHKQFAEDSVRLLDRKCVAIERIAECMESKA